MIDLAPGPDDGTYLFLIGGGDRALFATLPPFGEGIDLWSSDNDDVEVTLDQAEDTEFLAALYPELGVSFWITHRICLTASASYNITTTAWDDNFAMYTCSIGYVPD